MNFESSTDQAADSARHRTDHRRQGAQDAMQQTREMANESLEKAATGVRELRRDANPVINDRAARAQDLPPMPLRRHIGRDDDDAKTPKDLLEAKPPFNATTASRWRRGPYAGRL